MLVRKECALGVMEDGVPELDDVSLARCDRERLSRVCFGHEQVRKRVIVCLCARCVGLAKYRVKN